MFITVTRATNVKSKDVIALDTRVGSYTTVEKKKRSCVVAEAGGVDVRPHGDASPSV